MRDQRMRRCRLVLGCRGEGPLQRKQLAGVVGWRKRGDTQMLQVRLAAVRSSVVEGSVLRNQQQTPLIKLLSGYKLPEEPHLRLGEQPHVPYYPTTAQ
jgi:hypothetical protein